MYLAAYLKQLVDMVARGGEIEDVVFAYTVVTSRDDGFVVTLYRRHVEVVLDHGKLLELHAHDAGIFAQLDAYEDNLPVVEFKPVTHP